MREKDSHNYRKSHISEAWSFEHVAKLFVDTFVLCFFRIARCSYSLSLKHSPNIFLDITCSLLTLSFMVMFSFWQGVIVAISTTTVPLITRLTINAIKHHKAALKPEVTTSIVKPIEAVSGKCIPNTSGSTERQEQESKIPNFAPDDIENWSKWLSEHQNMVSTNKHNNR